MHFKITMIYSFTEFNKAYAIGNLQPVNINKLKKVFSKYHDSLLIYTGDFIQNCTREQYLDIFEKIEYILSQNNNYFLLIRGNEDNYKDFKAKSDIKKDLSEFAYHSILIPDYSIIEMKDHNILCIGGARTLNRFNALTSDRSKYEMVQKPTAKILQEIENVDIVISHAAPINIFPIDMTEDYKHYNSYLIEAYSLYDKHLKTDICKNRLLLKNIYSNLKEKNKIDKWIYGHYYKSNKEIYEGTEFISLKIKEIVKI